MADDEPIEQPNIGVLLFIPYRALVARVFKALAAAGFDDITPAQGQVFQNIGPDGTRLTELAARAMVSKQNASVLVDQLERSGYVWRAPDPTDGRARLIRVAERGATSIPVAVAAIAEIEAEWTTHLGAEDMTQLRRLLARLREITDPYADAPPQTREPT